MCWIYLFSNIKIKKRLIQIENLDKPLTYQVFFFQFIHSIIKKKAGKFLCATTTHSMVYVYFVQYQKKVESTSTLKKKKKTDYIINQSMCV